jgi:hypothetical protein
MSLRCIQRFTFLAEMDFALCEVRNEGLYIFYTTLEFKVLKLCTDSSPCFIDVVFS